jgi:hypothetical protein
MNTSNRRKNNGPVGYGRPPVERRFKPGQSGNPKGRPKNRKDVAGMLKDILDRPIKIRGGSGVRNITMLQAILEVTANKAVAGDARALDLLCKLSKSWSSSKNLNRRKTISVEPQNCDKS